MLFCKRRINLFGFLFIGLYWNWRAVRTYHSGSWFSICFSRKRWLDPGTTFYFGRGYTNDKKDPYKTRRFPSFWWNSDHLAIRYGRRTPMDNGDDWYQWGHHTYC